MQAFKKCTPAIGIRGAQLLQSFFISTGRHKLSEHTGLLTDARFPLFTGQIFIQNSLNGTAESAWPGSRGRRNIKNHFGPISFDEKTSNVSMEGGSQYSVIRIDDSGNYQPMLLNITELGIHPRDMDLLVGNFFIPKRSTIALRREKVLIRMENVRALVFKNYCFLFDIHPRKGLHKSQLLSPKICVSRQEALQKEREAFALSMVEYAKRNTSTLQESIPFHLRMIECMLEETCNFFHQKVERLKIVVEKVLEDLTNDVNMGGLQRLLPLKGVLTEVEHDISDTHEAIEQVLESDDALTALLLEDSENPTTLSGEGRAVSQPEQDHGRDKLRRAAADIILTYQRQVDDAGGVVEELRKGIDSAQEVWELTLDTTRNKIIRMNLFISMATLSFSLATVPASFFGMNLVSGLETSPHAFYIILGATSTSSVFVGLGLVFMFRKFLGGHRAQDLAALQDLLRHIDDIDEIFQALKSKGSSVSEEELKKLLRSHPSTESMQEREIDLMIRIFDNHRNSQLETREWRAVARQQSKARAQG